MADRLSEIIFEDDLKEVSGLSESNKWEIEKVGALEVWVKLSPAPEPDEVFHARLFWVKYPENPPSLKFRDADSGRIDLPSAWPQAASFRPQSLDTCVNWTSEGFALHPEWTKDPRFCWDSHGNVLLKVLRCLQNHIDTTYQGRFKV